MTLQDNQTRPVLVTGASKGIGRGVAINLARAGHPVTVHYGGDRTGAEDVVRTIVEAGGTADVLGFDVRDREATREALAQRIGDGGFWGVVLSAGVTRDNAFPAIEGPDWDVVLRTNLDGFYNVLQPLVMPMIRRRDGGRIVAIASVSGVMGNRGQVNYSASKAGLIGAAKALAVELAKRKITVNCVAPGLVETAMSDEIPKEIVDAVPMQRMGTVQEVAAAVGFLFSPDAGYITRQVLGVNGGLI
ncbi:3-ketoacyl-ACP reductase FabG2 [Brevundimonas sp. FT23028]|uniref:3-ketoacyl-ACP reductase FabG2 n=1 Tax=Brevundimonas sp. FT23028 TaxID=3393748 RepID=UPI003B58908B